MKKNLTTILITFLIFLELDAIAQSELKLDQAINATLEKNWSIKVSEKQIDAADNQIYKANAGMVPTIDLNANMATSFNQVNQSFFDGRKINRFGRTINPNTNIALAYTLYDGRRMFTVFDRLKSQGQQSRIQNQLVIQNTIGTLYQAYYDAQRLQKNLEYLNIIIKYYEERLKITEERWIIGRGSKLDYLQSKTDLNTQMANLNSTVGQYKSAKIRLNQIMGSQVGIDYEVEKYLFIENEYDLQNLISEAKLHNQEFLMMKKAQEINLLNQKEAASFKMPRINLNSSFGYSFNSNNAGLIALNQNTGLNVGVTASWRIFDGQLINRNIQLAKINGEILEIQKAELQNTIEGDLFTSYTQFQTDKETLKIETENKGTAEENLQISLEKFKLGASTILELNDAQTRFNTTLGRLVNAEYNVKISELELLKTSGQLVN